MCISKELLLKIFVFANIPALMLYIHFILYLKKIYFDILCLVGYVEFTKSKTIIFDVAITLLLLCGTSV